MHTISLCNNALKDLTLMKLNVSRLVGTESFLIRCSNGHTNQTHRHFKKVPSLCLSKYYSYY
jgi:hypothetical protein